VATASSRHLSFKGMSAERRKHTRTKVPGMRVTYEDTSGQRADAEVLDIGAGGLFVRCDRPLSEGKELTVELAFLGERDRLSALGRVAWVRPETGAEGPAGMGVRFVNVEATILYRIEQLIALRERTESAAPIIAAAPTRERTVLGVGWPQSPAKPGPELPTARAATPSAPEPPPEDGWAAPSALATSKSKVEVSTAPSKASPAAVGLPRQRRRRWPAVLLVLAAAGCAAYFMRARIPWLRAVIEPGSGSQAPSTQRPDKDP
jgi:uncharacterized protein (TIGR02266 family)